ncbi:MAG: tetratricopeptide repeat protein [Marinilabiliaceae bacterium]|nr:tetratricopeptide repeat protein [Marinilabiliaceae bacterium]
MINIVIKPFSNSVFFGFLVLLFCMFHLPHAYGNCFIERQKGNFVVDKKPDRINDSLFQRVKYLNQTGVQLRDSSLYKKALNFHFEALKLAEEIKDTSGLIHSLNNIGTDLRRTAAYMEASGYHYLALDLARSDKKYLKSKAIAMNGLGNIFLALEKCDYSLTYFEKALAIEIQLKSPLGQAINYANIGEAFRIKGQLDSALYYYNQSLLQNSIM